MSIPELILIPVTDRLIEVIDDEHAFEREFGATLGVVFDRACSTVEATQVFHRRINPPAEFGGYLAVDTATMQVIGGCGFKGGPDAAGDVEIAYGTFPPFEGRGYAKAMARALIRHAIAHRAPRVIAHTLAEVNASGSILRGAGFHHVGTVIADPEDGPVWRWELPPAAVEQYRA